MSVRKTSFSRQMRVKRSSEFLRTFRSGRSLRENGVQIYFRANQPLGQSRLGIIVSRKTFPRAVDRNRARRIVREYFRNNSGRFRENHDLIVRIVEGAKALLENKLHQILERAIERAGLFTK